MGLLLEMASIAMCKKPRPIHVPDWHVVKCINIFLISTIKLGAEVVVLISIKMGAKVVIQLQKLKFVVKGT